MYVSSRSAPVPDVEVSTTDPTAPPSHTIGPRELDRADNWFRTMRELRWDDALIVLHEYLNTGSSRGYEAMLKTTGAAQQPSGRTAPPRDTSWPEKMLALEALGCNTKLTLGMRQELFREPRMQGLMNRGHEKLDPSRLELIPLPTVTPIHWKRELFEKVFDPAVKALQPSQTVLICAPNAEALLIGKAEDGTTFGFSMERWEPQYKHPDGYLLRGRDLDEARSRALLMPTPTVNWLMLTPAAPGPRP